MTAHVAEGSHLRVNLVYVTWDAPNSGYLIGLFGPILSAIGADLDLHVTVFQFTWRSPDGTHKHIQESLARKGLDYEQVLISKRLGLLGGLLAVLNGWWRLRRLLRRLPGRSIVLARSVLPGIISLFARRRIQNAVELIFDADGLPVDERVEFAEMDPNSFMYRILRDFEAHCFRNADRLLVRADKAVDVVTWRAGPGVDTTLILKVTNGRDESLFTPLDAAQRESVRRLLCVSVDAPLICYVGSSFDGKYQGEAMISFFKKLLSFLPNARLLLLLENPSTAQNAVDEVPALHGKVIVRTVAPDQVARYIASCDLGLAFVVESYSTRVVSATKVGEYLLCGLPVVVTPGCGEIVEDLRGQKFCYVLESAGSEECESAAAWFSHHVWRDNTDLSSAARDFAILHCGLKKAASQYGQVIQGLLQVQGRSE